MQAFRPKPKKPSKPLKPPTPVPPALRKERRRAYQDQIPLRCCRCKYRWRRKGSLIVAGSPLPKTCPLCHSKQWAIEPLPPLTMLEKKARQRAIQLEKQTSGKFKNGRGKPLIRGEIKLLLEKLVNTKREGFRVLPAWKQKIDENKKRKLKGKGKRKRRYAKP